MSRTQQAYLAAWHFLRCRDPRCVTPAPTKDPVVIAGLVWLGLLALSIPGLTNSQFRLVALDLRGGRTITVTSEKDSGPSSLREAIFESARADTRLRIVLRVPKIVLAQPLPGLVSTHGVFIDGSEARTEIDASTVPDGPIIDLVGANSVVDGITVRGAAGQGILIRGSGARVTRFRANNCADGVFIVDEARDVVVEDSVFESNGIGVRVPASPRGIVVRGTTFRGNDQAGLWAVSGNPIPTNSNRDLAIQDNNFNGDRIGVVILNVPATVENNEFDNATDAAIHVGGGVVVRGNHIRGGGYGIFANRPDGATFEGNDISRSGTVAFLLRESRNSVATNNRLDANAFGIVTVFGGDDGTVLSENIVQNQTNDGFFVIGGSPLLRGNRVIGNRGAGLRQLDYVPLRGPRLRSRPTLEFNVIEGNKEDGPIRGEYREAAR